MRVLTFQTNAMTHAQTLKMHVQSLTNNELVLLVAVLAYIVCFWNVYWYLLLTVLLIRQYRTRL